MSNTAQYGDSYWCIKVPKTVSTDGEIYVMADKVEVKPDGSVVFKRKDNTTNLILAAGKWNVVYAASLIDGAAVAVEHWEGEVVR